MANLVNQAVAGAEAGLATAESLLDKLDKGVSLGDLLGFIDFPIASQIAGYLNKFLPINLLKLNPDGSFTLPSLEQLNGLLQNAASDIIGTINQEVVGILESLKGEIIGIGDSLFDQVLKDLDQISPIVSDTVGIFTDKVLSTVENSLDFKDNGLNYGKFLDNINGTIRNAISNLSPSDVQKLQDPLFFDELKNKITNDAVDNLKVFATNNAVESTVNAQLSQSSYLNFMKIANQPPLNDKGQYEIDVIRYVFWAKGKGANAKHFRKKSVSKKKLIPNYSLSSDGGIILVGSKVTFGDEDPIVVREVVEIDRTLTKRQKTLLTKPFLKIFFETYNEAMSYMKSHPDINVKATVTP